MSTLDRSKAPSVTTVPDISLPPCDTRTLPNGVVLNTLCAGDQPQSLLTLVWEGSVHESPKPSLPHFVFEAMREGTADYTGPQIADAIDYAGARLSSRISEHHSGLQLTVLNSQLPGLLPVLDSMIRRPLYEQPAIEMVGRTIAAGVATQRAHASYPASRAIVTSLRGEGHPAVREELPDAIRAVTPEEVAMWHRHSVGRGRLHAYFSGNYSPQLLQQVTDFLEALPTADPECALNIVPNRPTGPVRKTVERPDSAQGALSMGMPAIGRDHPDYIALRIAVVGLGGFFNSRLMQNIREEKGLTYGIGSALFGDHEGATVRINAQCDKAYIDDVIAETMAEMRGLVTNPIAGDELTRLKLNVWSSMASSTESPFAMMNAHLTNLLVACPQGYFEAQLAELASLTPERLADVAARYLDPDKLSIGICR